MAVFSFLNLKKLHKGLEDDIREALDGVMEHGQFINGPEVKQFEEEWAALCGVPHAIGCANGTAAMHALLACLDIGPGDEVLLPSHTFIASAESITLTGATPVFVDVDPETMLADAESYRSRITARTKAISVVHLYGMPVDFDPIAELAAERGIPVVEDACQAHGATYKGRLAGGLGVGGAFSFFPGKNLGAFGDAGGITVRDAALADRLHRYVNHGRDTKYEHLFLGTNYRLDTMQAAILRVKLRHLAGWIAARRALAARYNEVLSQEPFSSLGVRLQRPTAEADSAWHLYVARVPDRDVVAERLKGKGVRTGIHYPIPCHLQPALADYSEGEGSLPHTELAAREILSLPMCPTLTPDDGEQICALLRESLEESGAPA